MRDDSLTPGACRIYRTPGREPRKARGGWAGVPSAPVRVLSLWVPHFCWDCCACTMRDLPQGKGVISLLKPPPSGSQFAWLCSTGHLRGRVVAPRTRRERPVAHLLAPFWVHN
eukprot:scaffold20042_cov32-Tisochrysis_lutea.AAC.1